MANRRNRRKQASVPFHTLPLRTLSCVWYVGVTLEQAIGVWVGARSWRCRGYTIRCSCDYDDGGTDWSWWWWSRSGVRGGGKEGGREPGSSTISTPPLQRALGVRPQPHHWHYHYHSHSHARLDGLDRRPSDPTASNPAHLAHHSSPSILSPSCDHNNLHNTTVLARLPPLQHTRTHTQTIKTL
jgi:hypothetical protein